MMPPRPRITAAARDAIAAVMADSEEMVDEREGTEHDPNTRHNRAVRRGLAFLQTMLRWEGSHGAEERRRQQQAIKLLRAARGALFDELYAAGNDEVRQQPRLRAVSRLVDRIDKFLKNAG